LKTVRRKPSARTAPSREIAGLRARLAVADETLRAIRNGEVDTVLVAGRQGQQVFTLEGADHAYRDLIESMNEGALTLTGDKTILYANERFAKMVRCPLEQVIGGSFRRFLTAEDRAKLRPHMKRPGKSGSKLQLSLNGVDGSQMSVQVSIRPLARNGSNRATIGMVVTDLTVARRNEEMLRALTHRVIRAQEDERGRVAIELHDHITQLLVAVIFRSQALMDKLPAGDVPSKREAMKLREMLGRTAEEVERISRNLRPSVLDQLGLDAVIRETTREFAARTEVAVRLACVELTERLPAETELALYRILQEALNNVERYASARHVTVRLSLEGAFVQLAINDDGIGFKAQHHPRKRNEAGGLGLLGMRERAAYVGGAVTIKSVRRAGTEIEVRIPVPPSVTAVN
jgi:two-component system NarL family sensor kinase